MSAVVKPDAYSHCDLTRWMVGSLLRHKSIIMGKRIYVRKANAVAFTAANSSKRMFNTIFHAKFLKKWFFRQKTDVYFRRF